MQELRVQHINREDNDQYGYGPGHNIVDSEFLYSPIISELLTSNKITTSTIGSIMPLSTWENTAILISGTLGSKTARRPDHDQAGVEPVKSRRLAELLFSPDSNPNASQTV